MDKTKYYEVNIRDVVVNWGESLRIIRKKKRITLVNLSQLTGVQCSSLSRMENNKLTGSIKTYIAIANVLGFRLSEMFAMIEQIEKSRN
ncbi:MAG: helix-turn-helix transcriptional regulator [Candidatus Omnitrophica bacterium]|nr:helix-turn-helix transcriptional regulator [Candidatus Omnitrophota bacterium]